LLAGFDKFAALGSTGALKVYESLEHDEINIHKTINDLSVIFFIL
jgi:hypothetical protein